MLLILSKAGSQTGQTLSAAALKVVRNNRGADAGAGAISQSFSLLGLMVNGVKSRGNNVPGCS